MLLFGLALAIRFFRLGEWSFWADELATLRDAENLSAVRLYPIGYALIGWVVKIAGVSEFWARFVSALAGAATVPVLYLMGRRLFSGRTGLLAALFLCFSVFHVFFSQFARYYTLLTLFGTLAMWAFFAGLQGNNRRLLIVAWLLMGLSFFTHWSAGLLLPAAGVYILWARPELKRAGALNRVNALILSLPFLLGVALLPQFVDFLRGWSGSGFSVRRCLLTVLKLGYRLEATLIVCGAVGAWLLYRMSDAKARWLVCWAVAPTALTAAFVGWSQGGSRFGIVALPAVLLLAGRGLDLMLEHVAGWRRKAVWLVLALVLVTLAVKTGGYFVAQRGQRPRWRAAAAGVAASAERLPGRVLANAPDVLAHYVSPYDIRVEPMPRDAQALQAILASGEPAYVAVEHVSNVRPGGAVMAVLEAEAVPVTTWPLHVGPLDYGVTLYCNLAATRGGPWSR